MSKKFTKKYVLIDMGYGHKEYWVPAEVIKKETRKHVFEEFGEYEVILVELSDRTRTWVDFWKEV